MPSTQIILPWHSNGHTPLCQLHKSATASTLGFVPKSTYTAMDIGDSQRIGNQGCSPCQSVSPGPMYAALCSLGWSWLHRWTIHIIHKSHRGMRLLAFKPRWPYALENLKQWAQYAAHMWSLVAAQDFATNCDAGCWCRRAQLVDACSGSG